MSSKAKGLFEKGMQIFAYLRLYAPNLPAEDETTIENEIKKLINIAKLASDYTRTDDAKRWLEFCQNDIAQALESYKRNDADKGDKFLESARNYFEDAKAEKKSKTTFIVGPDGQAKKVGENEN